MEFYLNTTKYTTDELEAVDAMVADGVKLSAAIKELGVSYSPAWQYVTWKAKVAAGTVDDHRGLPQSVINAKVKELRGEKQSWGEIATTICINESAVRKAYELATNIQSVGTRTGKGGRMWGDDKGEAMYANELQGTGVTVEPGTKLTEAVASIHREPEDMSMELLAASIRSQADGDIKMPRKKADRVALLKSLTEG